jgi:flagellar biosynthetic protein FlhB
MAAESESGGEKTEEPSARRLQQARERGQVPRSRELVNFATMIGGSATLVAIGGTLASRMSHIMRNALSVDAQRLDTPDFMTHSLADAAISALIALLPIFGTLVVMVLLASVALGGWNFSPAAMTPNFTRMSPISGLGRLFGTHGVSELGKALLKCVVIGGVCAAVVSWLFKDVMALGHMAPRAAIGRGAGLLGWSFVWLCASLVIVALVDVPMQQQLARRRMMHQIPAADVVIVNPTHFAVALKYDPKNMRAPRVLAKGVDLVAANIRRIAEEHRIPVFESPKLARALYKSTDLNREIPAGLYVAVAQVLSYIFRVRTLNPTVAARVVRPNPSVGDEYADV